MLLDALPRRVIFDLRCSNPCARPRVAFDVARGRGWRRNIGVGARENQRNLFWFRKRFSQGADDKEAVTTQATPIEKPLDIQESRERDERDNVVSEGHIMSSTDVGSLAHHENTLEDTTIAFDNVDVEEGNNDPHVQSGPTGPDTINDYPGVLPDGNASEVLEKNTSRYPREAPEVQDPPAPCHHLDSGSSFKTSAEPSEDPHALLSNQNLNSTAVNTSSQRISVNPDDTGPPIIRGETPEAPPVLQHAPKFPTDMYMSSPKQLTPVVTFFEALETPLRRFRFLVYSISRSQAAITTPSRDLAQKRLVDRH